MAVTRSIPDRFRVAFSFAGEDRAIVQPLVDLVEQQLGESTVFYDEWYEHWIAGIEGDRTLQDIYRHRSDLVVVCVSGNYEKIWTRDEHRAIRTRYRSGAEADRLSVLTLRVGDGDFDAVLSNEIVPDYRGRLSEAAPLVIDRLRLLGGTDPVGGVADAWASGDETFDWPIADHRQAREAFRALLKRDSKHQLLPIRGSSETGKSSLADHMYRNLVQHLHGVRCGRLDLKGHTERRRAIDVLASDVGVDRQESDDWGYLQAIRHQLLSTARPTLLILDTYEDVGDLEQWVNTILLEDVARYRWLRLVILGQRVPEVQHKIWESVTAPLVELRFPTADEWFEYAGHILTKRGFTDEAAKGWFQVSVDFDARPSLITQFLRSG